MLRKSTVFPTSLYLPPLDLERWGSCPKPSALKAEPYQCAKEYPGPTKRVYPQSGTLLPAGTPGTKDARIAYPSGPEPSVWASTGLLWGSPFQAHWPRAVHLPQGHLWAVGRSPQGLGQRAGSRQGQDPSVPPETSPSQREEQVCLPGWGPTPLGTNVNSLGLPSHLPPWAPKHIGI